MSLFAFAIYRVNWQERTPYKFKIPKMIWNMSEWGCASYLETDDSSRSGDPVWKWDKRCWLKEWYGLFGASIEFRRALSGKRGMLTSLTFWSVQIWWSNFYYVLDKGKICTSFGISGFLYLFGKFKRWGTCLHSLFTLHLNFIWI